MKPVDVVLHLLKPMSDAEFAARVPSHGPESAVTLEEVGLVPLARELLDSLLGRDAGQD